MTGTEATNNTVNIFARCIADPTLVVTFVDVNRKLALMMIAIRTSK
jgi:hypothetical protein